MRSLFTLAVLTIPLCSLKADDWPQWLGPDRDGIVKESGLIDSIPAGGLKKLWTTKVGLGYAGPAVADGKLFLTDRTLGEGQKNPANVFSKDPVGGIERLLCYEAATGKQIWKHQYPSTYTISYAAGPRCTPTVDGDRVYFLGAMGDLFCLKTSDGSVIWSKNLVKDFEARVPVWGFACHPLIDGDHLIVVGGGSNKLVIAFDKKTGKVVWDSQNCEGDFGYSPPMIYEFGGRRQLIVWHARALVSLDPTTGKRLWSVPFEARASLTAPTARKVGTDKIFVSSFYNGSMLVKVTGSEAEVVWKSKARGERPNQTVDLSSIIATPFVEGDTVYGVCSYGQLRGLDVLTGKRLWESMQATRGNLTSESVRAKEGPDDGERWSNAFIVKNADRFFLFNEQGDLILANLSPAGYKELGRTHLIDPTNGMALRRKVVWMHPAFANKCIFVRSDEEMIAYSLAK